MFLPNNPFKAKKVNWNAMNDVANFKRIALAKQKSALWAIEIF